MRRGTTLGEQQPPTPRTAGHGDWPAVDARLPRAHSELRGTHLYRHAWVGIHRLTGLQEPEHTHNVHRRRALGPHTAGTLVVLRAAMGAWLSLLG